MVWFLTWKMMGWPLGPRVWMMATGAITFHWSLGHGFFFQGLKANWRYHRRTQTKSKKTTWLKKWDDVRIHNHHHKYTTLQRSMPFTFNAWNITWKILWPCRCFFPNKNSLRTSTQIQPCFFPPLYFGFCVILQLFFLQEINDLPIRVAVAIFFLTFEPPLFQSPQRLATP